LTHLFLAITLLLGLAVGMARAQDESLPTVVLRQDEEHGLVLTDVEGWTLYRWDGDAPGVSNCHDTCAVAWPPLTVEGDVNTPDYLRGALGRIQRPDGSWQVTFESWPLYAFLLDVEPGDTNGEGSWAFGSPWFVVTLEAPSIADQPTISLPEPVAPPVLVVQPPSPPPAPPVPPPPPTPIPTLAPPPTPAPTATPAPAAPTLVPSPTISQPGSGSAAEGPQFGNWGPGLPPPEPESVGQPTQPGAFNAPSSAAAPGVAPVPNTFAPVPSSICGYDLRGSWWNEGRQTGGGYRPYSATVYVRQYGHWMQGVQDDGTSYYGQCVGGRLNLDVYRGAQFTGRQWGNVYGGYWGPYPAYGEPGMPYAAPAPAAAPPPVGGSGTQANFTWATWYGSGMETWTRR